MPVLPFEPFNPSTTLATLPAKCTEAYEWLSKRGDHGATDDEGRTRTFFSYDRRRVDLLNATDTHGRPTPLVIDSGRKRPTPRGVLAVVWVARR